MLKRAAAVLSFACLVASPALAHGNPRAVSKVSFGGKTVAIEYGRPSLAGRDMLGKAPVGTVWRLGADAPTTLATEADLTFGTLVVPKGDYALTATRSAEDKWTLNVEKRDPATPRAPGTKIAEVPLVSSTLKESVEMLTLELSADKDTGSFTMTWGTTALKASFTAR